MQTCQRYVYLTCTYLRYNFKFKYIINHTLNLMHAYEEGITSVCIETRLLQCYVKMIICQSYLQTSRWVLQQ